MTRSKLQDEFWPNVASFDDKKCFVKSRFNLLQLYAKSTRLIQTKFFHVVG